MRAAGAALLMSSVPSGRHFRNTDISSAPPAAAEETPRIPRKGRGPGHLAVSVSLIDAAPSQQRADVALAAFSKVVLVCLWLVIAVLAAFALLPDGRLSTLFTTTIDLDPKRRLILAVGDLLLAAVAVALHRSLSSAWSWAHRPASGHMSITASGLAIAHSAVLDTPLEVPWSAVRAVSTDSGRFDRKWGWRRFPVSIVNGRREFLFSGDAPVQPELMLLAGRPVAPNLAILLKEPLRMRQIDNGKFSVVPSTQSVEANGPNHAMAITGLLLPVRELQLTHRLLNHTRLLRPLRADDVRMPVAEIAQHARHARG